MPRPEDVLKLLENGKWHDLEEIGKKIELQDIEVEGLVKFLARYNFVKLDKDGKKAKLGPPVQDFLRKIRQIEGKEGAKRLEGL